MIPPVSCSSHRWSIRLLALAPRRPWSWSPSTKVGSAQLVDHDHDLDHRPGAAVLSDPAPLLEPTHDHDAATLGQGLGGMLGLVTPDDHGEERCLLLPPAGHGHSEYDPGDAALGGADLGVVGEVARRS
jgi:hypothetical protein